MDIVYIINMGAVIFVLAVALRVIIGRSVRANTSGKRRPYCGESSMVPGEAHVDSDNPQA